MTVFYIKFLRDLIDEMKKSDLNVSELASTQFSRQSPWNCEKYDLLSCNISFWICIKMTFRIGDSWRNVILFLKMLINDWIFWTLDIFLRDYAFEQSFYSKVLINVISRQPQKRRERKKRNLQNFCVFYQNFFLTSLTEKIQLIR